jgi:hypothetical protein
METRKGVSTDLASSKRARGTTFSASGTFSKDSFAALTVSIDLGRLFEVVWAALAEKADAPQ